MVEGAKNGIDFSAGPWPVGAGGSEPHLGGDRGAGDEQRWRQRRGLRHDLVAEHTAAEPPALLSRLHGGPGGVDFRRRRGAASLHS